MEDYDDIIRRAMRDPQRALDDLDRQACKASLYEYVKRMWHVVEPATRFVDGPVLRVICDHLQAVTDGRIRRLVINVPPGFAKSTLVSVMWPTWEWGPRGLDHLRVIGWSYAESLATRDNVKCKRIIASEDYRRLWPHVQIASEQDEKTLFGTTRQGFRQALGITSATTGFRGDRLIVDDPHNVKDGESEAKRTSTVMWGRETMPSRVNDERTSTIVIIGQRVHRYDLCAQKLDEGGGQAWDRLVLPMEFDPEHPYQSRTSLGFTDWRTTDGELLWPERFPQESVDRLREALGPYAYACNPGEAPILMGDLSLRRIDQVQVGDKVFGWSQEDRPAGATYGRQRARPAEVLAVHARRAPVVKMTLSSGEEIRCTPDHRWYQRASRGYAPAGVGSILRRVCPPRLPTLSAAQERLAGWVAGFYDGEGSLSLPKRRAHDSRGVLVTFTQGAGKNLPLCEKLEAALQELGFQWTYHERQGKNCPIRLYSLRGRRTTLLQRFLHVIRPTKWREQIIEHAYAAKFIDSDEKVISVEQDGEETVYALTTTTGNYVVWGLASSNSQYQQRPSPREGGLFDCKKITYVDMAPTKVMRRARGWDLAATVSARAPYTSGVLMSTDGKTWYVENVRRERRSPAGVEQLLKEVAASDPLGTVQDLPQDPGQAGKSQKASFAAMLAGYDVRFSTESGDKFTRAAPFAAQVEAGNVVLVRGPWNRAFVEELALAAPGADFLDQMDAASRAFARLLQRRGRKLAAPPTAYVGEGSFVAQDPNQNPAT